LLALILIAGGRISAHAAPRQKLKSNPLPPFLGLDLDNGLQRTQ
jgi:hypothetical protein